MSYYEYKQPPIKFDGSSFEYLQGNGGFSEVLYPAIATGEPINNPTDADWNNDNNTIESIYGFFIHKDYLLSPKGNVEMMTSDSTNGCWDGSWHSFQWEYLTECFWISETDYLALGGTIPSAYEAFIIREDTLEDTYTTLARILSQELNTPGPHDMQAFFPVAVFNTTIGEEEVIIISGGLLRPEHVWYSTAKVNASYYAVTPTVYIKENDPDNIVHITWDRGDFDISQVTQFYTSEESSLITQENEQAVLATFEKAITDFVTQYAESVL